MKKQLFALLGLGLLLAVSANAQTIALKADIPFNFIVGGATLPAGAYTIRSAGTDGSTMAIRNSDNQTKVLALPQNCESLNPAKTTKLIFHRYGDRYFLSQVWVEGSSTGRELRKSAREVEVARDYPAQTVVLVATLH